VAREVDNARGPFMVWIIGNFLGVAALGALILFAPFLKTIPGLLTSTLIIGFPIGLAQWIALRRVAPISILWVLTISVGLLLALLLVRAMPERTWDVVDDESIAALAVSYATIGLTVGLIQWSLLRRQFSRSLVWLLSSSVGTGLGSALVLASGLINQSGIISVLLAVLIYASATGLTLEWLNHRRDKSFNRLPIAT